ncbi:Morn repeat domain containing protein [Pandoravirus salinus]|uniref:Morn repeat domain containing protein n=1 Tax=Pandoravirus salinus TaxID=1349410 RepID=S4VVH1_9VIRU|nr:morn repeat domain [Pandoravirus salinus]AGO84363.1 Morn repeat domain containing protein [Pandoravirus salinus]
MSNKPKNGDRRPRHQPKAQHINPWTGDAFSRLPDELVLAVLARTTKPADVARFGVTSRRMHEISLDDSLWRSFFQKRGHTLAHTRFAEFGKTWFWLLRVYSSDQNPAVAGTARAWSYMGDTDEIGRAHGYGVIHRVTTERYEGEWMRGYMHGRGVRTFVDGSVHNGAWSFNAASGHGTRVYADGSRYDGNWKVGTRHGRGTHKFADGDVYEGDWEWDKQHGRGTMIARDGSRREGQWRKGQLLDRDESVAAVRTWSRVVQQKSLRPTTNPSPTRKNRVITRPK